jgi:hypothetical protein
METLNKIPQDGQPDVLAFFRVKLDAGNIAQCGPGGKCLAVSGAGDHDIVALGGRIVGVDEEDIRLRRQ